MSKFIYNLSAILLQLFTTSKNHDNLYIAIIKTGWSGKFLSAKILAILSNYDLRKPTICLMSLSSSPHNRQAFTISSLTLPATSDLLMVFSHPQYLTSTRSPFRSRGLLTM